jgi:mRNA interferase MazF
VAQITSNPYADPSAVELTETDFAEGGLKRISYARPGKLFTAHESLFRGAAGTLSGERHAQVVGVIVDLLRAGA